VQRAVPKKQNYGSLRAVLSSFSFFLHALCVCAIAVHLFPKVSPNSTSQLHVLRHDGDPFAVDGAQVAILEEADQMRLRRGLKCKYGGGLPTVGLPGQSLLNFSYQPCKGEASDQKFGAVLVLSDFLQGLLA
jgi:hypothetical protein